MAALDLGPAGVALNTSPNDAYLAEAGELEKLGYSAVWLPGGELDSLDRLADIVAATTTVPVAPAIIPPDVYDSDAVTATYAQLERSHPGRFVVGLGSPQQPRQLRPLNDYLDRLDAADPPVPADRRILSALGPASSNSPATGAPARCRYSSHPTTPPGHARSWERSPLSSSIS